jgi:hypothetical protein
VELNNKMMKDIKKNELLAIALFSVLIVLTSRSAIAQTVVCTQNLDRAQGMFDIGDLPGIPALLMPCIKSGGFAKEENIRALEIMTETYLYQDDLANADMWMIELLKADPEHKLDPSLDPQEIILHKEKFRYKPIFRVSGGIGVNRSTYRLITKYNVGLESDEASYTPGVAFNGFLQIEKEVYPGFDIGTGVGFVSKTYAAQEEVLWGAAPSGGDINDPEVRALGAGNLTTYSENQSLLEAPVYLKYTYYGNGERKFNPYGLVGASFGYLLSATQSSTRRANLSDDADGVQSSSTLPDPNLIDDQRRKVFSYYGFVGLGGKIRQKTNFIFFEVRYNYGLMNLVDGTGRYPLEITSDGNTQESFFNIGLVDDDFTLDGLLGVVGYQVSIYSPKKLKQEKLK